MNFAQDSFVEYLVKKEKSKKDLLVYAGAGLLGAVVIILGVIIMFMTRLPAIAFFCLIGAGMLVWYLTTRRNIEFEYAVTNGYVSVDKIIHKSSRKRLTSFECSDVEEYGNYEDAAEKLAVKRVDARVFACSSPEGKGAKYIITRSKKTGYTIVVLDVNEDMEQAMKAFFPRQLRAELIQKERERR